MTRLFLCEKPSQAVDIARVLACRRREDGFLTDGNGTTVTWCIGHLLEQCPPDAYDPALKTWRYETIPFIPTQWKLRVAHKSSTGKPDPGYAKQLRTIRNLLKTTDEVVIACDAGREGEAIGREVLEFLTYRGQVKRLWLSAFVDSAIRKALSNLKAGAETYPLYQAALGRSRADWAVGLNLTRLYTLMARDRHVNRLLSVGRVQSPTLRLVVDRDRAIEQFQPHDYYVVRADCVPHSTPRVEIGHGQFSATWQPRDDAEYMDPEGRCTSESTARTLAQLISGKSGELAQVDTTRRSEPPPLPFSLSVLQQEASARFGMKANDVLAVAQSLYETHKLTTYPRSDSTNLPVELLEDVGPTLQALVQTDPALASLVNRADTSLRSRAWNDTKVSDHHAIIPTTGTLDLAKLSATERQIYDLVRRRYLAQFFPNHDYDQTDVTIEFRVALPRPRGQGRSAANTERFLARGRRVHSPGWRLVIPKASDSDDESVSELPAIVKETTVLARRAHVDRRQTSPPKRFTDGTLISAMANIARAVEDEKLRKMLRDTCGLGTEATRASIIETLVDRRFLQRQGKHLVSTPLGRALVEALPSPIKDPAMTALWEQALDDIAHGRVELAQFLERQYTWLRQLVDHVKQSRGRLGASFDNLPREDETPKRFRTKQAQRSYTNRGTRGNRKATK